jgi:hypothetical protein
MMPYGEETEEKTVDEILNHEIPNAVIALSKLRQFRRWMDENGASNRPLLIWQNMRIGEFYPYLTERLKKTLGIVEISVAEMMGLAQVSSLPPEIGKARYIAIKYKFPSVSPTRKDEKEKLPEFLEKLGNFAQQGRAPIVMVDSSAKILSNAQNRISNELAVFPTYIPIWNEIFRHNVISVKSSDDSGPFIDKLKLPTFLVLLNPTANAISWMDGSVFLDLSDDLSDITLPEDMFVCIADEVRSVPNLVREIYGNAMDAAANSEIFRDNQISLGDISQNPALSYI